MHPNLLAYKGYEVFDSEDALEAYRKAKLKSVEKNVKFVKNNCGKNLKVLEIGSGMPYSFIIKGLLKDHLKKSI